MPLTSRKAVMDVHLTNFATESLAALPHEALYDLAGPCENEESPHRSRAWMAGLGPARQGRGDARLTREQRGLKPLPAPRLRRPR